MALILWLCLLPAVCAVPWITVSPDIITSGTWVEVAFGNVSQSELERPSTEYVCKQDGFCNDAEELSLWIGVFCRGANFTAIGPQPTWSFCANAPWVASSPIKWKPVTTASGSLKFHLEASRAAALDLVLFSNGTSWPLQLASTSLTVSDSYAPKHVHLSRDGSSSRMRVSWSSLGTVEEAKVRWGFSSGSYQYNTSATSETYVQEDTCGEPATSHGWLPAPWFHTAILENLPSQRRVFYTVGSDASGSSRSAGWTAEKSFAVPEVSRLSNLRVVVFADLGESYVDGAQYHWMEPFAQNTTNFIQDRWARNTRERGREGAPQGRVLRSLASESDVDLILHVGDISYATGYESEWDRYMAQIEPLASGAPLMVSHGNHDRDWPGTGSLGGTDSGGECGVAVEARFKLPVPHGDQDKAWYSFEQGPVHFIMMDTEFTAASGSPQFEFLAHDLQEVDRSVTPWVVFAGHRPMYDSVFNVARWPDTVTHDDQGGISWWPDVEALLVEHHVDLCFWAHVHNAEWTCPMVNGTCVESAPGDYSAPVHAVIGNAGQSLTPWCLPHNGSCCCSSTGVQCAEACEAVPAWSLWRMDEFGFSVLEVDGPRALTVNFYTDCVGTRVRDTMTECTESNKLVKSFTIERDADLWKTHRTVTVTV
mmetsp:Transcript_29660/g.78618  ORF Transcript_29660/g.78618 Transcript_29660/m.78618 type:complete len:651 (-) Transcript_29660:185-2137(-)